MDPQKRLEAAEDALIGIACAIATIGPRFSDDVWARLVAARDEYDAARAERMAEIDAQEESDQRAWDETQELASRPPEEC